MIKAVTNVTSINRYHFSFSYKHLYSYLLKNTLVNEIIISEEKLWQIDLCLMKLRTTGKVRF